jgi:hypothetical protein
MPCVGFEPTIPASERAKTVYALECSATVTGGSSNYKSTEFFACYVVCRRMKRMKRMKRYILWDGRTTNIQKEIK